jgi:hypothetical protein
MTVLENLKTRHMDLSLHTAWIDEVVGVATFPLWNLSGQLVGFQQYRPSADKIKSNHPRDSRYFTHRKDKVVGVWGLESWNSSNMLFVTEGIFDAARLSSRGYSAIATLSNDVDLSLRRWIWTIAKIRPVIAVCDDDAAGRKLASISTLSYVVSGEKDLSASSDTYIDNFLVEMEEKYGNH